MNEQKKISSEDLSELKSLKDKYQEKVFAFGQLYIEKLAIDEQMSSLVAAEEKLKQEFQSLQKSEKDLMSRIVTKYGEGNLNLNDGTLTII